MKARGDLVALVCALAALSVPAVAEAQPGYTVKPKSLHLELDLPASNGYSALISTEGHRQVVLNVSKGYVFARYTALGKVSRKGIEADFGTFGHVYLRFRSKRRYHPSLVPGLKLPDFLKDRCKGRRTVAESGVFLGNVRFEGEHGFTRVKANRRKGKVVRSYRRVCKPRSRSLASKIREENVFIAAQAKRFGVTRFLLTAVASLSFRDEKFAFTFAIGGEKEKVGRVAISRGSILFEERDSIVSSPLGKTPVTAKVKLPEPFEGTATYLEEGSSPPSWTGNIGVRLPGGGLVPLAGPEFEAELCRGDKEAFRKCLDSFQEKVQLSYGSGSHSQPLALARLSSLR
jgi:hypothetical protein